MIPSRKLGSGHLSSLTSVPTEGLCLLVTEEHVPSSSRGNESSTISSLAGRWRAGAADFHIFSANQKALCTHAESRGQRGGPGKEKVTGNVLGDGKCPRDWKS